MLPGMGWKKWLALPLLPVACAGFSGSQTEPTDGGGPPPTDAGGGGDVSSRHETNFIRHVRRAGAFLPVNIELRSLLRMLQPFKDLVVSQHASTDIVTAVRQDRDVGPTAGLVNVFHQSR